VPEDRQMALELIEEAVSAGARSFKACAVLGIDVRMPERWKKARQDMDEMADWRKAVGTMRTPVNKLSAEERANLLDKHRSRPGYWSFRVKN